MRNIATLVISGILLLSSCAKEDPTPSIIGEWFIADVVSDIRINNRSVSRYYIENLDLPVEAARRLDRALISETFFQASIGTVFTLNADASFLRVHDDNSETGTWEQRNNELVFQFGIGKEEMIYDITMMSADNLNLNVSELASEDLDGNGIPELIRFSLNIQLVSTQLN